MILKYGLGICVLANTLTTLNMVFLDSNVENNFRYLFFSQFLFLVGFWFSLDGTVQIYTPEIVPVQGVVLCIFVQYITAGLGSCVFPLLR